MLGSSLNFMFNIFNGFVITYPAMPVWWRWMNRVVPTTWVLYGLGSSQLGDRQEPLLFAGKQNTIGQFVKEVFG